MARWGFWDWVAYLCLGIAALGLAAGAALNGEPAEILTRLPDFVTSPKWAYLPIMLFALGTVILVIRLVAPLIPGSAGPNRIFVEGSPEQLMSLVRDHTHIQKQKLSEVYIGKWLRVSGSITEVRPMFLVGVFVAVDLGSFKTAYCWFKGRWLDRLKLLQKGQAISAIGRIHEIEGSAVVLKSCEIVDKPHFLVGASTDTRLTSGRTPDQRTHVATD